MSGVPAAVMAAIIAGGRAAAASGRRVARLVGHRFGFRGVNFAENSGTEKIHSKTPVSSFPHRRESIFEIQKLFFKSRFLTFYDGFPSAGE